jgi:glycosyltransferase involved in cell wall biosynthesis
VQLNVLSVGYPLAAVSTSTAGGAEQILATIDEALVAAGHGSIVIAPEGSRCKGLLIPTHLPAPPWGEEQKRQAREQHHEAIRRTLQQFPIDVVHMHGIDFVDYLPLDSPPIVVTLHLPLDWYPARALRPKRPNMYFVAVSESQARTALSDVYIDRTITNGVQPWPGYLPKKHRKYVLAMGRICPEKGFHLAMDAAHSAGFPLRLAGTIFEYPEHRKYFEAEIKPRLQTGDRFIHAIGGDRKRDLISGAHCVVVSSQAPETSCLVAMEALACGIPVVAFEVGALPEIIDHGRTGFLVHSVEEMAQAIRRAHQIRPEDCRRVAKLRFSAEIMTAKYLELYRDVVMHRIPKSSEVNSWASQPA